MQKIGSLGLLLAATTTLGLLSVRCGTAAPDPVIPPIVTGGATTGGADTATGGIATGGVETGGTATGGISTGGIETGGTTGGTETGGTSTGGTTGGTSGGSAGSSTGGGAGVGGGGNGGAAGAQTGGGGAGGAGGGGAGGGGAGGGGAGGGGAGGAGPGTFTQVAMILQDRCGTCHSGGTAAPLKINLRNEDGMLYMRLTTALTSTVAAKCNTRVLVDKTTPANSLLSQVIKAGGVTDTANNCTIPQMPLQGTPLSATDSQTIDSWINAGAPQ